MSSLVLFLLLFSLVIGDGGAKSEVNLWMPIALIAPPSFAKVGEI